MAKNRFEAEEVAKALGLDKRTIYRHIREKRLPAVKVGRSFIITRGDLVQYLGSEDRVDELFGAKGDGS